MKDKLKPRLKKLLIVLLIFAVIIIAFKLFGWYALIGILLYSISRTWINKKLSIKQKVFKTFWSIIKIVLLIYLFKLFGGYGVFGWFIYILILSAYKIWVGKEIFMGGVREIETSIWGKPAEEFKGKRRPKVKIKWKRKDLGGSKK